MWYVIEVMAETNTDIQSGIVFIIWCKDLTLWDVNERYYERMICFFTHCWPVQRIAKHVCCAPWVVAKIMKPVVYSLMDKHARSRTLVHHVPEGQIVDVLSSYGILKIMLPTEMGGTIQFDQAEWMASRRAAELKEI
jgi:hypothetical protein